MGRIGSTLNGDESASQFALGSCFTFTKPACSRQIRPRITYKRGIEGISGMKTSPKEDEELMRKLDRLMKDPVKWKEYIESRADKAIRHWPKR